MFKDLSVFEAKRYGVWSCSQQTPLFTAAQTMANNDIGCLVIVDDSGYLTGIITRFDLIRACCERKDWADQHVKDYMNQRVVTVTPDTQLEDVAHLLLDKHIHRVVVVRGEQGKERPIAVMSASDLIFHMSKAIESGRVLTGRKSSKKNR